MSISLVFTVIHLLNFWSFTLSVLNNTSSCCSQPLSPAAPCCYILLHPAVPASLRCLSHSWQARHVHALAEAASRLADIWLPQACTSWLPHLLQAGHVGCFRSHGSWATLQVFSVRSQYLPDLFSIRFVPNCLMSS